MGEFNSKAKHPSPANTETPSQVSQRRPSTDASTSCLNRSLKHRRCTGQSKPIPMDKISQESLRKIASTLSDIKRLIHQAVSLPREEKSAPDKKKTEAENSEDRTDAKIYPVVHCSQLHPPATQDQETGNKKNEGWKWLKEHIVEIPGVFVVGAYTIVSSCQLVATKEANRIAFDGIRTGQRAFVYFDKAVFNPVDRRLPPRRAGAVRLFNLYRNTKKVISVNFALTNSGNTPTTNLTSVVECLPVGLDQPATVDPFMRFRWDDLKAVKQVIGPKQTVELLGCDLTAEDILNASTGVVLRYFVGEVRYRDIIDPTRSHITQFAHRLVVIRRELMDFSASTEGVGQHNCADEDCK